MAVDGKLIQFDANLESVGCEGCYCKIQATITFKGMIRFELVNDFVSFIIEVRSDRPIIDPCNLVPEILAINQPSVDSPKVCGCSSDCFSHFTQRTLYCITK